MSQCEHDFGQVAALTWKCSKCHMEADATYMAVHFSSEVIQLKRKLRKLRSPIYLPPFPEAEEDIPAWMKPLLNPVGYRDIEWNETAIKFLELLNGEG